MKVLGLISSPYDPASRARIIQYKDHFKKTGHNLEDRYFTPLKEANPKKWNYQLKRITGVNEWRSLDLTKTAGRFPLLYSQSGYDLIWQNRLLHPHHFFWETKLSKPVVFDFDDAIWLIEGEKQVNKKIEISSVVFAGNDHLAEYARKYNTNVHIIPTTIDTAILHPLYKSIEWFTIGWIGTESNFKYLETIYQPLKKVLSLNKDCRLMIVSSKLPDFIESNNQQIIFKPWATDKENEYINQFSVGVMPLTDNEWTRGKCSYKLLQYLACGIPAIASPVGANKIIIRDSNATIGASTNDEWEDALKTIIKEADKTTLGSNGRKYIENYYSCQKWSTAIIEQMNTII